MKNKGRVLTLMLLLLLSIVFLAWFDAGEEALHTIVQPLPAPAPVIAPSGQAGGVQ
ncbi:MAG: hypothetical protein ABJ242_10830 [Marinomonas sp.]